MTPEPKSPQFIRHNVPKGASENLMQLYKDFLFLQSLAKQNEWDEVKPDNFVFEYSTNDNTAEIIFVFIDKNEHSHKITVGLYGDDVSTVCMFSYRFKADNFDETTRSVQSFAECLMVQLWEFGIDADLCDCDWGLGFTSSVDSITENMGILVRTIVSSIKPMEWFYSDETIWEFHDIHSHLLEILPKIQHEADTQRWKGVTANNFTILRDQSQAYIVLTYQYADVFDMTFRVGLDEYGFVPDVTGEWFICEYKFNIHTSDKELYDHYLSEERECCKMASVILDMISYNALFAYDKDNTCLTLLVKREWSFQKYCLMLDVVLPILFKHEVTKPTKNNLSQKEQLEALLNMKLEIVDCYSNKTFSKGEFLSKPEDPNTIFNKDLPF